MRRGTVVPGALAIILIFLVALSCMALLIAQFNQYSTSVKMANMAASERNRESLEVTIGQLQGNSVVGLNVTNTGSTVVLVVGWVKVNPEDRNPAFYNFTEGPYAIQPPTSKFIPLPMPGAPKEWYVGVFTSYGNVFWVAAPPASG